jgi:hypothetical protein
MKKNKELAYRYSTSIFLFFLVTLTLLFLSFISSYNVYSKKFEYLEAI